MRVSNRAIGEIGRAYEDFKYQPVTINGVKVGFMDGDMMLEQREGELPTMTIRIIVDPESLQNIMDWQDMMQVMR